MLQIIVGFPIELIKLCIFLLYALYPSNLFYHFQLIEQVLVLMLDMIQLPLDYDLLFVMVLQSFLHYL
jgi:hypothetical protein